MNNSILKSSMILIVLTLAGRISGFLRELVLAYIYGASATSDAYIAGSSLAALLFSSLSYAFLISYVPVGASLKNNRELNIFTSNLSTLAIFFVSIVCFILIMFLKPLVSISVIGFAGETLDNTIIIAFYGIITIPFLCVLNILVGYLNIKGNFASSSLQSIITNIVVMVALVTTVDNIALLGIGIGLSNIIPVFVVWYFAKKNGFIYFFSANIKDDKIATVLKMAIPIIIAQISIQLNAIIDRSFASTLAEGTISSLKYGNLLCVFVYTSIATSIATVIYPKISLYIIDKNIFELKNLLKTVLSALMQIITPFIIGAVVLNEPVISLLFERGSFTSKDTLITANVLSIYAFGIIGSSFFEILNKVFYAMKDTKTPTFLYSIGMFLNIFLNYIFIDIWGAKGLALATSISLNLIMFFLFFALKKKIGSFGFLYLIKSFYKTFIAGLIMAGANYYIYYLLLPMSDSTLLWRVIMVFTPAGIGIILYILALIVLKSNEISFLWERLKSKIMKK